MGSPARAPKDLNPVMVKFLPETDSEYATYPMKRDRWFEPDEAAPDGKPCFIPSEADEGIKKDYVYGRKGPKGKGYYHLLTHQAHTTLYSRIANSPPGGMCNCFSKAARTEYDEWDDLRRVFYNRYKTPRPDDVFAAECALKEAQGVANVWYNALQNEQLAINAVQTGINLAA